VNKPRLELISPFFLKRLGLLLGRNAKPSGQYHERNWEKGIPFSRCIGSTLRHVVAFMEGREDEDHLAAAACNLMFLVHFQELQGRANKYHGLDERPGYTIPQDIVWYDSEPELFTVPGGEPDA
jgi:hypothetical protein